MEKDHPVVAAARRDRGHRARRFDGSGSAAAAKTVNGTVGPTVHDRTDHAEQASHETEGRRLGRFVISDRSSDHNFHLTGPRLNRELTGGGVHRDEGFLLKLRKGTCRFFCDPHADFMRGRFLVS